jgi:hypothetical protein
MGPSLNHPRCLRTLGVLGASRLVGHVFGIVVGFGVHGWDTAEAVHQALLVVLVRVILSGAVSSVTLRAAARPGLTLARSGRLGRARRRDLADG